MYTRPAARAAVLGLRERGADGDGAFNPRTGAGHVDYARAQRAGPFALELLREFLAFYGLHQTLCVFVPESALRRRVASVSRCLAQ